jgi:hypothetical protein
MWIRAKLESYWEGTVKVYVDPDTLRIRKPSLIERLGGLGQRHLTINYRDGERMLHDLDRGAVTASAIDAVALNTLLGMREPYPSAGGYDV